MNGPKFAIVLSTTRPGALAIGPLEWMHTLASQRDAAEFEIVDLRDYPLPFFEEAMSPAWAPPKNEIARRWARKVDEADDFIFITAESNHGIPALLKNALNYVYKECNREAGVLRRLRCGRRFARDRTAKVDCARAPNRAVAKCRSYRARRV